MVQPHEEALHLIQESPDGLLQSELWKRLGVDSRKCSRIVKKLLDAGQIERTEFREDGIKTFILRVAKKPVDPACIMAGDELIPCIGCEEECNAELCTDLRDWMYQLAICQVSR